MKLFFGIIFALLSAGFAQKPISTICEEKPINYYVQDITNCSRWFQCTDQVDSPISGACSYPYHFNESRQVCTEAETESCFTCPSEDIVHKPVENTCNRFVLCLFGTPIEWYCEDGKQYNAALNLCDDKSNVQCEEPCPLHLKSGEFTATHDSTNCSVGFVCFGEPQAHTINCPNSLHFDTTSLMCVQPEKSTCISKEVDDEGNCLTNPVAGEFIAKHDSTNCSIGLVCYGEPKAYTIYCNEKLHFDTTSLMCVQPEMSDCIPNQTTVINTSPTTPATPPTVSIDGDAADATESTNPAEQPPIEL